MLLFPMVRDLLQHIKKGTVAAKRVALLDIWGPFGSDLGTHLEAEGRHFGGRRPTKWGSGGGAPREKN